MKSIKKSLGTGISMLLLLLFSVTILPLDFLHNHSTAEQIGCGKKVPCSHTVHINKKAPFCWVCAIHYDTSFTTSDTRETTSFLPVVKLFIDNAVIGYAAEIIYTTLRGPPAE